MLTAPMADEIRRLRDSRVGVPEIAATVGVSKRLVYAVIAGTAKGRPLTAAEQVAIDAQAGWAALCMTDDEWIEWRDRNPLNVHGAIARPCEECPLGFAADMRAQGRCNGTPGGVAEDTDEPTQEETPMDHADRTTVTVELVGGLPCGSCAHAEVCRIRPQLLGLRSVEVSVPAIDDAITMRVAADIDCDKYLRAKGTAGGSAAGRKLNLSPEERARRGAQARANTAARLARQAVAS